MPNVEAVNAPAIEAIAPTYNLDDAEFEGWHSDNEVDAWNLECAVLSRTSVTDHACQHSRIGIQHWT